MLNTNEASDVTLTTTELTEEWARLLPQEWQNLPMILAAAGSLDDGTPTKCLAFSKKCKGENPTDEEVADLIKAVKAHAEPVAWLGKMYKICLPEFADGKDPTVKEFFEGGYDTTDLKSVALIICYPHFAETK